MICLPCLSTADGAAGDVPWPKVQRRIAQLIKEDRFYTQEEQDRFDNIDPIAIREALAERGIVNGQVADPEKLDSDPFIQQVMRDVEAVATEEQAEAAAKPPAPDLSGQPVTREGDTLTIGSGEPTHEIDITVSDEEYEAIRQAIPENKAYDPIRAPVLPCGRYGLSGQSGIPDHRAAGGYGAAAALRHGLPHLPGREPGAVRAASACRRPATTPSPSSCP